MCWHTVRQRPRIIVDTAPGYAREPSGERKAVPNGSDGLAEADGNRTHPTLLALHWF